MEEICATKRKLKKRGCKSGVRSLEKLFIGLKAFNEEGSGKALLFSFSNPHTCRLDSRTVRRLTNRQVIMIDECDSLA